MTNPSDDLACATNNCQFDPDNPSINQGVALLQPLPGISCYLNLATNGTYCVFGAATSGYSTDNLQLSYYYDPSSVSQVLQCNNLGSVTGSNTVAVVHTTFTAPDAPTAKPLTSIVADWVTAKYAHSTAFSTGTSMTAVYLKARFVGILPQPYVAAKCFGSD